MSTIPFNSFTAFTEMHEKNLNSKNPNQVNISKQFLKKQSLIQSLNLNSSNTKYIIHLLLDEVKSELKSDIHGLGHLSRWFYRFNISCPILASITVFY